MNILITSGGTAIPIDNVRNITNFSGGAFGAKLAKHHLLRGNQVTLLRAASAPSPFEFKVDLLKGHQDYVSQLDALHQFAKSNMKCYTDEKYVTFNDYRNKLYSLLDTFRYDVVFLAAAVSDYTTEYFDGKVRSKDQQMSIQLTKTEKVITTVREKHKGVLVGFKLLSNVTNFELVKAANDQINNSGSDFVVANRLEDLQRQERRVWLVRKEGWQTLVVGSSDGIAKDLLELIEL